MKKYILFSFCLVSLIGCSFETPPENIVESDVVVEIEDERRQKEAMEYIKKQEEYKENTEFGVEEDLFAIGPVLSRKVDKSIVYYFPGMPQRASRHPLYIFSDPLDPSRHEQEYMGSYQNVSDYIQKKDGALSSFRLPHSSSSGISYGPIVFELPVELPGMKHTRTVVTGDSGGYLEIDRLHVLAIDYDDNIWHFEDRLTFDDHFMQKVNLKFLYRECEGALGISWEAYYSCREEKNTYLVPNRQSVTFENKEAEEAILTHLQKRLDRFIRKIQFKKKT